MTPLEYLGIPVAMLGAFLLSFGSAVQQTGVSAQAARGDGKGGLAIAQMLSLARNRDWLGGTVMVILAIVCQLTALGLSPIAVVQPIGILALVVTAMISARKPHNAPTAAAVRAIGTCVIAVVIFVTVAALTTHIAPISNQEVIVVLIIAGTVVVVLGGLFLALRRRLTRTFYVIASGVLFGFVATFAKVILGRVETVVAAHQSPFAVGGLTYVCLLGVIVAGSLGQYLQQSAFTFGSPEAVVAGLTVIDPIVGATIGLVVLGEATGAPLWSFVVFAATGLLSVWGVIQLSRTRPGAEKTR